MDSNHRRHKPAGLQPDPFGRSGTDPRPKMVAELPRVSTVLHCVQNNLENQREDQEEEENRSETKGQQPQHANSAGRGWIDLFTLINLERHVVA